MITTTAVNTQTGELYYYNEQGSCMYICPSKNIHEAVRGSEINKALKRGFIKYTDQFETDEEFNEFLKDFCKGSK